VSVSFPWGGERAREDLEGRKKSGTKIASTPLFDFSSSGTTSVGSEPEWLGGTSEGVMRTLRMRRG